MPYFATGGETTDAAIQEMLGVRSCTATQQLLVSKVQCGTHARSGRGPGSVATVVSEKELKKNYDAPD